MSKTASGLVDYCKAQLGLPYWMGTYGNTATKTLYEANKKRLPEYYIDDDFPKQFGKRVHDCVGLIKGYRWSATPTSAPVYNAAQDVAVSGLYDQCSRKGLLKSMPKIPGVCVFMPSHVGVYIGDGLVIEARGHAWGVVKTRLVDRGWTKWGMPDWITYDTEEEKETCTPTLPVLRQGMSGDSVKKLQLLLNGLGYSCGQADGDFGAKTLAAVKSFQIHFGLASDGVVGKQTWGRLLT